MAYTQFATWAAVEYLARHDAAWVREAGDALAWSVGNERGTSRLPCEVRDRLGALRQEEELAVLAAFFCLLFFAAAKKSRCRPAQGRRVKHANASRMPAQKQKSKSDASYRQTQKQKQKQTQTASQTTTKP
ncbi:hypothetical protein [Paraburkholderia sp. PGU19]|uniref:hypothetical protein n=1 Tax=Paraburkholderia sp. PGU19 TaxID=2735434 RepID=UPI0015DAE266|nr:hypothetical protein [Paraburkholderia sp. PGU19]